MSKARGTSKSSSGRSTRARSAISGRYVTKSHARRSPRTTVVETVRKGKK